MENNVYNIIDVLQKHLMVLLNRMKWPKYIHVFLHKTCSSLEADISK